MCRLISLRCYTPHHAQAQRKNSPQSVNTRLARDRETLDSTAKNAISVLSYSTSTSGTSHQTTTTGRQSRTPRTQSSPKVKSSTHIWSPSRRHAPPHGYRHVDYQGEPSNGSSSDRHLHSASSHTMCLRGKKTTRADMHTDILSYRLTRLPVRFTENTRELAEPSSKRPREN